MSLGAASPGLHATFVSLQPNKILPMYFGIIAKRTGMSQVQICSYVNKLINECQKNNRISLLGWKEPYSTLPERFIAKELGVVIPTVWWEDRDAHNIVLTGFNDPIVKKTRFFTLDEFPVVSFFNYGFKEFLYKVLSQFMGQLYKGGVIRKRFPSPFLRAFSQRVRQNQGQKEFHQ